MVFKFSVSTHALRLSIPVDPTDSPLVHYSSFREQKSRSVAGQHPILVNPDLGFCDIACKPLRTIKVCDHTLFVHIMLSLQKVECNQSFVIQIFTRTKLCLLNVYIGIHVVICMIEVFELLLEISGRRSIKT